MIVDLLKSIVFYPTWKVADAWVWVYNVIIRGVLHYCEPSWHAAKRQREEEQRMRLLETLIDGLEAALGEMPKNAASPKAKDGMRN